MEICFKQHFNVEPSKVVHNDLEKICQSKDAKLEVYQSFTKCLATHWSSMIDKELERIIANRINCSKSHHLSLKPNSTSFSIDKQSHDDDELAMLEEIVAQVAESELKRDSSNGSGTIETVTHISPSSTQESIATTTKINGIDNLVVQQQPQQQIITVIQQSTTSAPSILVQMPTTSLDHKLPVSSLVEFNTIGVSGNTLGLSSGNYANFGDNVTVVNFEIVDTTPRLSTKAPQVLIVTSTQKPTISPTIIYMTSVSSTKSPPITSKPATTNLPSVTIQKDTTSTVVVKSSTKAPAIQKTTNPPKEIIQIITIEPELTTTTRKPDVLGKKSIVLVDDDTNQTTTQRPVVQIVTTSTRKPKVEDDKAQKAIKDLISQRQNAKKGAIENHEHESRLHAIEHERQMLIDPIGHTIKHQKYELAKEQKLKALRASLSGAGKR